MVDATNTGVGVLIDLDLAAPVDTLKESASHAGTLPFLAIDLIPEGTPMKHYYRHDLESFYYTLVWAVTHFHHGALAPSDILTAWYTGTWREIRRSKGGFLMLSLEDEYPSGTWLKDDWLCNLGELFALGYSRRPRRGDRGGFDEETLAGVVTFDSFLACLS